MKRNFCWQKEVNQLQSEACKLSLPIPVQMVEKEVHVDPPFLLSLSLQKQSEFNTCRTMQNPIHLTSKLSNAKLDSYV